MSSLKFTAATARALETFYSTRDVVAQRAATLDKLRIASGESIIDIGCGPGFLTQEMAKRTGPDGTVLGIDISPDLVQLCQDRSPPAWVRYNVSDALSLPEKQGAFDVAVSAQVVEYIPDTHRALCEMHRVLAPGGRGVVMATDWGTVGWHSADPDRMAHVMHAWQAHCAHPHLPRTLGQRLHSAGFEVSNVSQIPLTNTRFEPEAYSFGISKLIRDFVTRRRHIDADLAQAWYDEFGALSAAGEYYFASARILFEVRKPV